MRADWLDDRRITLLLTAMMPANRLAMETALATALRIDDVLSLKTCALRSRMTVTEKKTDKHRRIYIPARLLSSLQQQAGRIYVFPHRLSQLKHRTRQAVYKDLRRAARLYRIDGRPVKAHVSPHSSRKIWAVKDLRAHHGDIRRVQHDLLHSDPAVTALYAYADRMTVQ